MSASQSTAEKINQIPRLRFYQDRTPLRECVNLRKTIPGSPRIFIKRDDLSGFLCGGNKLRKLEYIMADAKAHGATAVTTVGSIQSNHARVTAMVARSLGLKCALILNGDVPGEAFSNFLLSQGLASEIHYVDGREDRMPRLEEVSRELEKKGENVYRIPLGASNDIGSLGFVAAFNEAMVQSAEMGWKPDAIIFSSSSGGTQAGFEAGKRLNGNSRIRIIGVSPDDSRESIRQYVLDAMLPILSRFSVPPSVSAEEILVDEGFIGAGYGIPTKESEKAARPLS